MDVGTGRALSFGMTDRTSIALRLARLTDTRSKRVGFWEALEFSIEQAGVYMAFEGATRDEISDAIFDAGISLNLAAFAGE